MVYEIETPVKVQYSSHPRRPTKYVVSRNHVPMVCQITFSLLRYNTHPILDALPSTWFLETTH
jgi:hypothetical protein